MNLFRETSKTLRMRLSTMVIDKLTEGGTSLDKIMLGNIVDLQWRQVYKDIGLLGNAVTRSEDQLYYFNELLGESLRTEPSALLDHATGWLLDNDCSECYEIVDLMLKDRPYRLPAIIGFSLASTGVMKGAFQDFGENV